MRSWRLRRRWLAAAIAALVTLGVVEAILQSAPRLFGQRNLNLVLSRYDDLPGGMYFRDPPTRMLFMWPDASLTAYFNGYRWRHRTDSLGYRNPPGTRGDDVVLLGDSLIYGHGVEENQTLAHFLRAEHGLSAYNMARQGNCLWQEYVALRLHLDSMRPRAVVLFAFRNDLADLFAYREAGEIAAAPELGWDYGALRGRLAEEGADRPSAARRWLWASATLRLARGAGLRLAGRPAPLEAVMPAGDAPLRLYETYVERLLTDAGARCRAAGSRWIVVSLAMPAPATPAEGRAEAALMRAAARAGVETATTAGLFDGCTDCILEGDGHLGAAGHRRLADFVARLVASAATQGGGGLQTAGSRPLHSAY
jgi:hypothetical protein